MMQAASIRDNWDWVKSLLIRLHERDCERGLPDWIPEDIYAACVSGAAHFYLAIGGFVVLQKIPVNNSDKQALLVWVACSNDPDQDNLIQQNAQSIKDLAASIDVAQVEFYTTRKGYDKIIGAAGYKFAGSKYVMEV
jgi:hypothetical protein